MNNIIITFISNNHLQKYIFFSLSFSHLSSLHVFKTSKKNKKKSSSMSKYSKKKYLKKTQKKQQQQTLRKRHTWWCTVTRSTRAIHDFTVFAWIYSRWYLKSLAFLTSWIWCPIKNTAPEIPSPASGTAWSGSSCDMYDFSSFKK